MSAVTVTTIPFLIVPGNMETVVPEHRHTGVEGQTMLTHNGKFPAARGHPLDKSCVTGAASEKGVADRQNAVQTAVDYW